MGWTFCVVKKQILPVHVHLCWKQEHLWPRTRFCTGCSQSYGLEGSAKYTHPACHRPIPPLAGLLLQFHTNDCMLTKDQSHIRFSGTEEIAKTEKLSKNITDKRTNNATLAVLVRKQFFSIPLVHSWCCCHFISEGEYFANVSFNSKHSWWGGVGSRAANASTSTLVFLILRSDTQNWDSHLASILAPQETAIHPAMNETSERRQPWWLHCPQQMSLLALGVLWEKLLIADWGDVPHTVEQAAHTDTPSLKNLLRNIYALNCSTSQSHFSKSCSKGRNFLVYVSFN